MAIKTPCPGWCTTDHAEVDTHRRPLTEHPDVNETALMERYSGEVAVFLDVTGVPGQRPTIAITEARPLAAVFEAVGGTGAEWIAQALRHAADLYEKEL